MAGIAFTAVGVDALAKVLKDISAIPDEVQGMRLAVEHLTEVAWDRALNGEVRNVYYHGELVGETRHFDNRLLLALIAQNRAVLASGGAGPALASPTLVADVAAVRAHTR